MVLNFDGHLKIACQTRVLTLTKYTSKIPPLSGVITCAKPEEYSWPGTMIIPLSYLIFPSSPSVGLISPFTLRKKEEEGRTYIHVFPSLIFVFCFKQVIAQKFKQS